MSVSTGRGGLSSRRRPQPVHAICGLPTFQRGVELYVAGGLGSLELLPGIRRHAHSQWCRQIRCDEQAPGRGRPVPPGLQAQLEPYVVNPLPPPMRRGQRLILNFRALLQKQSVCFMIKSTSMGLSIGYVLKEAQ